MCSSAFEKADYEPDYVVILMFRIKYLVSSFFAMKVADALGKYNDNICDIDTIMNILHKRMDSDINI